MVYVGTTTSHIPVLSFETSDRSSNTYQYTIVWRQLNLINLTQDNLQTKTNSSVNTFMYSLKKVELEYLLP